MKKLLLLSSRELKLLWHMLVCLMTEIWKLVRSPLA